jgi:hypothetical protein
VLSRDGRIGGRPPDKFLKAAKTSRSDTARIGWSTLPGDDRHTQLIPSGTAKLAEVGRQGCAQARAGIHQDTVPCVHPVIVGEVYVRHLLLIVGVGVLR